MSKLSDSSRRATLEDSRRLFVNRYPEASAAEADEFCRLDLEYREAEVFGNVFSQARAARQLHALLTSADKKWSHR